MGTRHLSALLAASSLTALFAGPASADELRDLCTDRPGLGTPACTLDAGHLAIEVGIADWTHDRNETVASDAIVLGDALLRAGLDGRTEVQLGWTAFGTLRERDLATGDRMRATGVGDVTLAIRHNLMNPQGHGFSIAVMPFATLPTGGSAIGAGDWSAGLLLPMSLEEGAFSLALTPEVDAAVDEDRHGRHLTYGAVAGIGYEFAENAGTTLELAVHRDDDPDGHATETLAGLSAFWQPNRDSEWDVGLNAGLNREAPDVEVYFGYVRRF